MLQGRARKMLQGRARKIWICSFILKALARAELRRGEP
jgi:hypothetical protein